MNNNAQLCKTAWGKNCWRESLCVRVFVLRFVVRILKNDEYVMKSYNKNRDSNFFVS
jgi:hypothetical protein